MVPRSRSIVRLLLFFVAFAALVTAHWYPASAQKNIRFIRDAEIEETIRTYATPLFQAAGLNPNAVDVYLIQEDSLNAFVAGGQNIFLHTGLLVRAESVEQIMGVIAHETGHIAAGHLAGRQQQLDNSLGQLLASYAVGIGAAILSGRPEFLGMAARGGQDIALRNLLTYTRSQEASADQAAVKYMNESGFSPLGLVEFLDILSGQEFLLSSSQDPYLQTHPLSRTRVALLEQAVEQSPHKDVGVPAEYKQKFQRMQAKLIGFLYSGERVRKAYPAEDVSVAARYARAIAHFRVAKLDEALAIINGLIAEHPDDPYFHELKGQMLFENGYALDAVEPYRKAVELRPNSPLLRLSTAQVLVSLERPEIYREAIEHLDLVLAREPRNAMAWRLKSIAHGRLGEKGETAIAMAEGAMARGDIGQARQQAARAAQYFEEGTPGWLRSKDIEREAERIAERRKN
ncbi:MAG: M48 family metalloprotease [Rhodovibrionaceae bacterium]|nr:M48 family metalloprotease [Rhodovibrionaceae bacterium]